MYVPASYVAQNPRELIRSYPFANLITVAGTELFATSVPLVFETDNGDEMRMMGHLAMRNEHADQLTRAQPALAIFNGPNAYVSSRWYVDKPEVPTWNYLSVQLHGELEPLSEPNSAREALARLIAVVEHGTEKPWRMDDVPEGAVERLLPMIRAFRITISSLQGVAKLSQSHPAADRLRVIRGLLSESDADGRELARIMAQGQMLAE